MAMPYSVIRISMVQQTLCRLWVLVYTGSWATTRFRFDRAVRRQASWIASRAGPLICLVEPFRPVRRSQALKIIWIILRISVWYVMYE
jgi:hypothetical protein